jgi:hypothetical protein
MLRRLPPVLLLTSCFRSFGEVVFCGCNALAKELFPISVLGSAITLAALQTVESKRKIPRELFVACGFPALALFDFHPTAQRPRFVGERQLSCSRTT